MEDMPRPRKPFVQREVTRHKTVVWYFRRGKGPRIRLTGEYESPEWLRDYDTALGVSAGAPAPAKAVGGTLGWLIDRYFDSADFRGLAEGTQRARRSILTRVKATAGHWAISAVTSKRMAEGRDLRSGFAAVAFIKAMRGLFRWAVGASLAAANPTEGIKTRVPRTDGFHTWTVEEVRQYHARHPFGSKARLALDILLFTGLRKSDAVTFGRQHIRSGTVFFRASKNGVEVEFQLLEPLRRSIEGTPEAGPMTLLVTGRGRAFTSAGFGNWFRDRCVEAGVPGRAHGLRKAGATIAAENGATEHQLMAMYGWTDPKQAEVYTRKARRAVLARGAASRLTLDELGTSIPAPADPLPRTAKEA